MAATLRMSVTTRLASSVGDTSRTSRRRKRSVTGTSHSNSAVSASRSGASKWGGSVAIHDRTSGRHPSWWGSK